MNERLKLTLGIFPIAILIAIPSVIPITWAVCVPSKSILLYYNEIITEESIQN
jgi:hypothetical protein